MSDEARGVVAILVTLATLVITFAAVLFTNPETPVSKILLPKHLNNHTLKVVWLDETVEEIPVKGRPGIVAEGRMLGFQPAGSDDGDKTYIMLHQVQMFEVLGPPEEE